MSAVTPLRLVFLLSRSGETETLEAGNGGSLSCAGRGTVVVVLVLSDCWALITFALGFLKRSFNGAAG